MYSVTILCTVLVLLLGLVFSAPSVISTQSFLIQFPLNGNVYKAMVIVSTFNDTIYYRNSTGNLTPASGLKGFQPSQVQNSGPTPNSIVKALGSSIVKCGSNILPPALDLNSAPFGKVLVGAATSAPLATLLLAGNGYDFNETVTPNQHATLILTGYNDQVLLSVNTLATCQVLFNNAASFASRVPSINPSLASFVSDSAGNIVSPDGTFNIPYPTSPNCTLQGMKDLRSIFQSSLNIAASFDNANALGSLDFIFASLTSRPALQSCLNLTQSFFNFALNPVQSFSSRNYCPYDYNSAQWFFEPCCNYNLQQYVCCLPKPITTFIPVISGILSGVINGTCKNPPKIAPIIYDFIDSQNKANGQPDYDSQSRWDSLTSFYSKCQSKVYNQVCSSDTQCYSKKCDTRSGYCIVYWGDEAKAMTACFLDQMPQDLRFELKALWNLPPIFNSSDAEAAAFAQEFNNRLLSLDCTGQTAYNYASRMTYTQNADGSWTNVWVPGNMTGCLSDKQCNYQPWSITNNNTCLNVRRKQFCSVCYGSSCNPVTQPPNCYSFSLDQATCLASNGTWNSGSYCTWDVDTRDECYAGSPCSIFNMTQDACTNGVCYALNMNSTSCSYGKFGWNNPLFMPATNSCVLRWIDPNSCRNYNFTYYASRYYNEGTFHTKPLCDQGMCDVPYLYGQSVDPVVCRNTQYCTQPCTECQGSSVCINATATSGTCSTYGGYWQNGGCILSAVNATDCSNKGGTYSSCGNFNSQSTCQTGSPGLQNSCWWNTYGNCKTRDICLTKGYCNDYEFNSPCDYTGCSNTGVCYRPTSPGNQTMCDGNSGENWARYGCTLPNLSQSQCINRGYIWKQKAQNATACAAHGTGCLESGQFYPTPKNATECQKCGGTVVPLYTWTPANWLNGTVQSLTWKNRSWESVNQWKNTLDYNKLNQAVNKAVGRIVGREYSNLVNKKYSTIFNFLQLIACSCGSDSSPNCFGTVVSTNLANCLSNPGVTSNCEGVNIGNDTFPTNSSVLITIDQIASSNFVVYTSGTGRSASLADVQAYAVITQNGKVVGQIIGNGKKISTSATPLKPIYFCLDTNPSIPQDNNDFPTYDFVQVVSGTVLSVPLKLQVTNSGLTNCAYIPQPGTYMPIIRVTDVDGYAGAPRGLTDVPANATTTTTTTTTGGGGGAGGGSNPTTTTTPTGGSGGGNPATTTTTVVATTTKKQDNSASQVKVFENNLFIRFAPFFLFFLL